MNPPTKTPARRWTILALAACVLAASPLAVARPLSHSYHVLCAGPVDLYPLFAAARDQAQAVRDAETAPTTSSTSAAQLRARALDLALRLKQSDVVAFPTHAAVGAALELRHCAPAATGDQWRKAAAHAWSTPAASLAAAGLARTMGPVIGPAATLDVLQRYAAAEPWHAPNLARVAERYRTQAR